jgi:hypothetical protein
MKQDLNKIINTRNKLWISWKKAIHTGDGNINLIDPKFTGNILSDCDPIEEAGTIKIDMTHQYLLHIPQPYLIQVSWEGKYKQDKEEVLFKSMTIKDGNLGKLSILKDKDSILLDCTDHTTEAEKKGLILFNFYAVAFNSDKSPYNFNK